MAAGDTLSEAELEHLLGAMKRLADSGERPGDTRSNWATFENHPLWRQMKVQRDFAALTSVDNPYYRIHKARAGATSLIEEREVLNFASYDYLGLNGHPEILEDATSAARTFGTSVSASRISAGERSVHRELESALAKIYQADDCIAFVSGHAGAISTIATLLGQRDLIIHDEMIHNCILLGAQLSGAARRSFPHNDLQSLEAILRTERASFQRVLIVVEGLYSMDGDGPDLPELVRIKHAFDAILMVDEAHSLGVLGARGHGLFEEQGVEPGSVDLWFGTLSKTLVSCGGYVAASQVVIDILKYNAPGFVYSVGMPVSAAVAATKAIEIMNREPERVKRLRTRSKGFLQAVRDAGLNTGAAWGAGIVPVIIGDTLKTVALSHDLLKRGVNAFPVLPPGVPDRTARLRFFISASHTEEQIDAAAATLVEAARSLKLVRDQKAGPT